MKEDLPELSGVSRAALERERSRAPLSPAARARLFSRLQQTSLAVAAATAATATPAVPVLRRSLSWPSALGGVVAGAVLGAAAAWSVRPEPERVVERVVVEVPVAAPPAPAPAPQPAPAEPSLPARVAPPRSAPRAIDGDAALADERALIDRARTALSRGELDAARSALNQHRQRHPSGTLAEDRDGLEILALVREQQPDQAAAKLVVFKKRYRQSLLIPTLSTAIAKARE